MTDLEARIEYICEQEGARLAPGALQTLIACSAGDLRKAITFLQSGYNLQGSDAITSRMISEMAGIIPEEMIQDLIDTVAANNVKQIQKKVQDLMNEGFAGENIVAQVHEAIIKNDGLTTLQKARIAQCMGTVDIDLVQGADEHLQVLNLMVHIGSVAAEGN